MKLFFSACIFLLVLIPLLLLNFIIWDEKAFILFGSFTTIAWLIAYVYIDRILLAFLGAREVIGTDENTMFQVLKNNAYKNRCSIPRVYVYDGQSEHCFLFESLTRWTMVLDKTLLSQLDYEATEELVEFYYAYHLGVKRGYLKTKALGICVLFYTLIYKFFAALFFQKTHNRYFKAAMSFFVIMFKPFIWPFEALLKSKRKITAGVSLKKFSLRINQDYDFSQFLSEMVIENSSHKTLITQYMESYPLLSECEFSHDF